MTESCPACGKTPSVRVPYPSRRDDAPLEFTEIALCPECGLGMALPRHAQADLDAFYAAGTYWSETVGASPAQALHERNQCRHRVELALARLPARSGLRVLDVGAGHGWTGQWLETLAPGAVAQFEFIEPDNARSREILTRARQIPTSRLESLNAAEHGYDLIFLNHVLEHVADPLAVVRQVRTLLDGHGIAYFEMPHADQRFKADVFPHTWFFTPAALERLASRAAVTQVLCESFGQWPGSGPFDLLMRAGFRASASLGLRGLSSFFDDRVWRYHRTGDGIWLRWIISR